MTLARTLLLAACTLGAAMAATAGEAEIRKNLPTHIPPIDEVTKSPIAGLYEVRVNGSQIFYTDEQGSYLIQGNLIDAKRART
jgi:thiol:disulfide interchange protein DsbC